MTLRTSKHLLPAAALLLAAHAVLAQVPSTSSTPATRVPDHAAAYYHDGLAHLYEELAINNGRPDYAAQAVEEYKLALDADPNSRYLQDGLADLYFKIGRIREAVSTAQEQAKKDPSDIAPHELLGKVYLRSLGDMQGPQANDMLQLAIAEYEKLAQLKPKDLETHLLLGQLYGLNHDTAKAEAQFKLAQSLDGNSEDAVLNMARLYAEQGDTQKAVTALTSIPADDRSARIDLALGAAYDQLKNYKQAATAYKASLDEEPDNAEAQHALALAYLNDNNLPAALTVYQQLTATDANDIQSIIKTSEIQRRQGHYDQALATLNKAKSAGAKDDNLELDFNEALVYDSLGKYDQAIVTLRSVLLSTEHADGKYNDGEKSNRAIFLERLGVVYREQNKTSDAVDAYKSMIALGGEYVARGYQGEIDSYRDAHQWKDALGVAAQAAKAQPKDRSVQLTYAFNLADTGQPEEGLTLAKAQLAGASDAEQRDTDTAIANIDLRLHRTSEAFQYLDKADALSTRPEEHMYIDLLRATVYDHDKQYDQAEIQYRKALTIDPDNANVLNDLGFMLADRGQKLPEALKMIQRAVELDPQNGAYLDSLGWIYFKLAQYPQAEENLKKAIDRTASDPSIHDHLADVYEKTGHLKQAVDQWERSLSEYAHSLPADADPQDVAKVKHKLDDARTKLAKVGNAPNKKS